MKKLISLLVIMALFCASAFAEIDLTSMTYDQLLDLREQISRELTTRPEWQNVEVPIGVYEIGVDIPAGHWTLTGTDGITSFEYGKRLNDTKTGIDYSGSGNEYCYEYDSVSIELHDGYFILIDEPCIFTPYVRPSLGFK